ncbi:MAG: NAD(P)H-dependent oxidoreductase [gamma proteobacterium symbiont of Lucinoma myriamae]|nr:NAD(P)H-dependent oxidoreductase [gamma proteobacterium symbiont of Lucinoma myriamae]MCU7819594.1 NAD(P)H-dependent oxidoreductase [gamma proteobacterium symbiont of Lucinoma myriamae]MCU7832563.1 NAD(P)H-dependent oxidoreductase [gamma proteobacterium symbiont of Lucinoma myriamae]
MKEQFIEMMNFRHACKVFDENKKISDDDFQYILESARLSPSSFGFEPWHFLIVQNPVLKDKLKALTWGAQGTLPTASHFVVTLARTAKSMRFDTDYIENIMAQVHHLPEKARIMRKQYYQEFQENDFNLLQDDRALLDWATKQTYIALANMMNAAAFIKIDSCPIEGFKAEPVNQLLASDFDIDTSNYQVAYMVAFGYRKNPQNEKTRQKLEDIVSWY